MWFCVFPILVFFPVFLSGQSFSGRIHLVSEDIWMADEAREKSEKFMGRERFAEMTKPRTRVYSISGDSLLWESFSHSGEKKSIAFQVGGKSEVRLRNTTIEWSYDEDPGLKFDERLWGKRDRKSRKSILGFPCTRYEFEIPGSESTFECWITDDIPFDPAIQTEKYFAHLFSEYGLILEMTQFHESVIQRRRVFRIEIEELSPAVFEDPFGNW